jgi:RNA polymerase sigma-70 factor (ECF subfamily)
MDDIETLRPRLFRLAYRMLGSRQDAEDAVQEALLRWYRADTADVRSCEAWLVTALSRVCVDRLRLLATEREAYVGPWLPEPLIGEEPLPDRAVDLASDLSMALLVVLERLSPEERVAFLMHDVFDCDYPDIAAAIGKSEVACRQLVHRSRERVRREKPRFEVTETLHARLVERYVQAVNERDAERIAALLAPDAVLVSDGGGKTWAALRPVIGAQRIARLEVGVVRKLPGRFLIRVVPVNGVAGSVSYLDGHAHAVTSFETDGERILSVMRVLNPDKLAAMRAVG